MESTIAVIADKQDNTICSINTTKHNDKLINGYPFTPKHANNLKQYEGKEVLVSVGHTPPIKKELRILDSIHIGSRIIKLTLR